MEDSIKVMLQEHNTRLLYSYQNNSSVTLWMSAILTGAVVGFQCTGFEINSMLQTYPRDRAWWRGKTYTKANFVSKDFWKTDLSRYNNVTVFMAPAVMEVLEKKLLKELSEDARVVVCRFHFPHWPHNCSKGAGLNQVWAYDVSTVRKPYPSVSQ
ncbi:ATP synthase subunit C lysine N-methyltransferase-like [Salvelinus namaycush]|uniref:ATP synthase subunit C lysine N-methyltransferase-like n=1 Tax=Salvelinus namaycush TaxID=8040 RepID=A0A8U0PKX7_SALNM|nr:ATP synthase subunit C lysine N-methyltransferase-like [Salvelinus namaycush]